MEDAQDIREKKKKRRSLITSLIIHLLLVLLALLPLLTYQEPPPGQEGVMVSFGSVDVGSGEDLPMTQDEEQLDQQAPAESPTEQSPPVKQQANEIPEEVVTKKEPDAAAIEKRKREEEEQRKQEEARRKAAEEARKEAEEEARKQREYEERKKQFGQLLEGSGKGETETVGNQGDPEGEPGADKLQGISKGSGMVGGGLGNRGVLNTPDISDASQKQGTVVMRVCVDAGGEVVSAEYTQRGSTTTDSYLVEKARKSAFQFRFTESDREKQCGTITIVFKLQ